MVLTLYHYEVSAPSRAALMVCRALNLDVNVTRVNLANQEQFNGDFIELNPQHCVPTLVDGDFVLWESRAIACYLVTVYGKDDLLYPKDTKRRALVDQRLYFDSATLLPRIREICHPVMFLGVSEIDDDRKEALKEALDFLNTFLEGVNYLAGGNNLTIADICTVASLSNIIACNWDMTNFKNLTAWFERCKLEIAGYYEINEPGATTYGTMVKSKLAPGQI